MMRVRLRPGHSLEAHGLSLAECPWKISPSQKAMRVVYTIYWKPVEQHFVGNTTT